jgi:hypothetical protein
VAGLVAFDTAYPVQRVAAFEKLQITWPQGEPPDKVRAAPIQHCPHAGEILLCR